jgi:hypothetical protein
MRLLWAGAFQRGLMVAERVPLWEVMTEWQRMGPAAVKLAPCSPGNLRTPSILRTHLLGLGLTVFILLHSYRRCAVEPEGGAVDQDHPHFEAATHFLKRPVVLSLLITLVLSLVFFTDNAHGWSGVWRPCCC